MRIILKLVTVGVASLCALALSGWSSISFAEEEPQPAMVVIIDDIGDNLNKGLAAVHLPGPVTLAIMPHTPMDRFGDKEELVGATLLLASGKAGSFVTGTETIVDGGYSAMTI